MLYTVVSRAQITTRDYWKKSSVAWLLTLYSRGFNSTLFALVPLIVDRRIELQWFVQSNKFMSLESSFRHTLIYTESAIPSLLPTNKACAAVVMDLLWYSDALGLGFVFYHIFVCCKSATLSISRQQ